MKPTIADVIDRIGLGATHVRYVLCGGGVWFADGLELSLISSISVAAASSLHVGPDARGMLVTIVYIGVFFGNILCGPAGDRYGRRFCIIASYLGIFIFSILSSFAPSYVTLAGMRLLVGMCFGFGQPVWNTLATEISPCEWRTLINAVSQALFTVGEVYCYLLVYCDDPWMKHLNWRRLLQEGAVPSLVFFFLAVIWLLQSPYFLAAKGQIEEAQEVLKTMQRDNCIPEMSVDFYHEQAEILDDTNVDAPSEFGAVFSGPFFATTIIITYTCFVMNFVYYGSLYAFPQVLPQMSMVGRAMTPAMDCLVGALWEFPGYALAVIFAMYFARKPVTKLYCVVCGISCILFVVGAFAGSSATWHIGLYGVKCSVCVGYVVVYVYLGEVYPTKVRVTGGAVSIAGGRIGSMLAPLAYEILTSVTGTYSVFFLLLVALCFTNIPLIDVLPVETFNAPLSSAHDNVKCYGAVDQAESDQSSHQSEEDQSACVFRTEP